MTSVALRGPTYPTIPHIVLPSQSGNLKLKGRAPMAGAPAPAGRAGGGGWLRGAFFLSPSPPPAGDPPPSENSTPTPPAPHPPRNPGPRPTPPADAGHTAPSS